jgi:hypothetical protein
MHVSGAEGGRPDLQALKHLALEGGPEALRVLNSIPSGGYLQFLQARNAEPLVKLEHLVRTQARN